jgi:hypothetical protein
MFSLNLSWDISCYGKVFVAVSTLSRQILGEYFNYAMTTSFQIISCSSFVILPLDAV